MFDMFGAVIMLLNFVSVKRLSKIFVPRTVQKFGGCSDKGSTHRFFSELRAVEAELMREIVPLFFGLKDEPEESMSRDEMAHLSVLFAGTGQPHF